MKYRLKDAGKVEADIAATFARVARAVAEAEAPEARARWADAFLSDARLRRLPARRPDPRGRRNGPRR